jgi:hypothetical protein
MSLKNKKFNKNDKIFLKFYKNFLKNSKNLTNWFKKQQKKSLFYKIRSFS